LVFSFFETNTERTTAARPLNMLRLVRTLRDASSSQGRSSGRAPVLFFRTSTALSVVTCQARARRVVAISSKRFVTKNDRRRRHGGQHDRVHSTPHRVATVPERACFLPCTRVSRMASRLLARAAAAAAAESSRRTACASSSSSTFGTAVARRHRRDCEGGRAAFCHRSQRSVPRCCSRFRRAACDVHLKRIGRPGGMEIARHDVRISHHHVWVLTLIQKQMTLIHWGLTRRPCIPQSSASLFAHTRLTLSCDSLQVCHRVRGFVFLRPRAPTQVGLGEARPGWCW
jgi:hypothetical protein